MTTPKSGRKVFGISHDSSKQALRLGTTVGGKCVFVEFSTRKGDVGSEYLTRTETDQLIDWLRVKREQLSDFD